MVTVLLSGGLGNQMFQYAAAKSLATRLNAPLYLNTYTLTKKTQATARNYELDIFKLKPTFSSSLKGKWFIKARPFIQKHRNLFIKLGFVTDTYAILYQPIFEKLRGNIILSGYFQNEQYFRNIRQDILEDFTFNTPLSGKNEEIARLLKKQHSVSIHIRRGDYTTNKSAIANFITCDVDYYHKAIEYISDKIENPSFYIFSDDMEWVKANIDFKNFNTTFVDWNTRKDSYIDMQLMSLCSHNIIANSSFSWWGAWLNRNKNKIVIAPSRWFRDEDKNKLLDNFLPKEWYKI